MAHPLVDALIEAVGSARVSTVARDLEWSSHDTWPLSTKWACTGHHPHKADIVVRIDAVEQVAGVLRVASEHGVPVTPRGLGSSVTGQPLPTAGGIVLDLSRLPQRFSIDEVNATVTATASFNGGALEEALVAEGWTMANSPQSLHRSTVGGWLATLQTGQFSSLYGGIEDLVVGYAVVLATGESIELKASPRAAMGPDLRQIFLGSEGTLAVITSVTLKIFPIPQAEILETIAMPTVSAGLAFMREQALAGLRPFLLRLYDLDEARHTLKDETVGTPILFLGSRGIRAMAEMELRVLVDLAKRHGGTPLGPAGASGWMARRFNFSAVENLLAEPGGFAETIEVAHVWSGIKPLYCTMRDALLPLADEVLSHFSHVYTQGTSMYVILLGRADGDEEAVERLQLIWRTAMDVCLEHGAELSHHHGGGLARSPYSRRSLGPAHLILRKLKAALDPAGILNPGKLGL